MEYDIAVSISAILIEIYQTLTLIITTLFLTVLDPIKLIRVII